MCLPTIAEWTMYRQCPAESFAEHQDSEDVIGGAGAPPAAPPSLRIIACPGGLATHARPLASGLHTGPGAARRAALDTWLARVRRVAPGPTWAAPGRRRGSAIGQAPLCSGAGPSLADEAPPRAGGPRAVRQVRKDTAGMPHSVEDSIASGERKNTSCWVKPRRSRASKVESVKALRPITHCACRARTDRSIQVSLA